MKKIVLFIMMFLCSIMPIHANSLASITIELQDSIDDLSKENVDFKLVQVAKLEDGYFVLNDAFQDLDVDFNVEFNAEQIENLCDEIQKKDVEGLHVKTDSKGIAKVEDIEQGLYFIDPVDLS